MHGLSAYELALILDAAIGEPPRTPPGCVDLLIGCVYALVSPSGTLTHRTLVDCRFLFNKIMRFLSVTRTQEERVFLGEILMTCRCRGSAAPSLVQKSPAHLHSPRAFRPDQSFSSSIDRAHNPTRGLAAVITRLCQLVTLAFSAMNFGRLDVLYRSDTTGRSSWPTSLDDICPFPITSSLEMVAAWTRVFKKDEPAHWLGNVMNSMIVAHKTNAIPTLWDAKSVWYWIRRHTRHESSSLSAIVSRATVDSAMVLSHTSSLVKAADLLSQTTRFLFKFELFRWLMDISSGDPDFGVSRILRLCDNATRAVDAAADFLERNPSVQVDRASQDITLCRHQFPELASVMHAFMNIRMKAPLPAGGFCSRLRSEIDRLTRYESDSWLNMVCKGFDTPWTARCYAPRCFRTYASEQRKFQVCGGCKKAAYCYRQCQRSAWNHRHSPHREVCFLYKEVARLENQPKIDGTLPSRLQILLNSLRRFFLSGISESVTLAAVNNIHRLSDDKFVLRSKSAISWLSHGLILPTLRWQAASTRGHVPWHEVVRPRLGSPVQTSSK
jgi:hypothetical protein